jgi:hypothetical protein
MVDPRKPMLAVRSDGRMATVGRVGAFVMVRTAASQLVPETLSLLGRPLRSSQSKWKKEDAAAGRQLSCGEREGFE